MVHRIIIVTVITIINTQSSESVKIKNIIPEYRFNLRRNYSPNTLDNDFNTWEVKQYNTISEEIDAANSRRIFEWFSKLFQTTTPKVIHSTSTTTESSYTRELKERIFFKELHRNLTEALQKISEIQKRVTEVIDRRETHEFLTKNKPIARLQNYRRRFKREEALAEDTVDNKTINADNKNLTDVNSTICPCANDTSGRRFASDINPTEIKNKLLLYLEESFQDIQNKIVSLKNVKEVFNNNESFKIGYIISNIDTLEANMLNLKKNVDDNKMFWEEKKILELYDTLKMSNQAVSGLIQSLKLYMEKLSSQS